MIILLSLSDDSKLEPILNSFFLISLSSFIHRSGERLWLITLAPAIPFIVHIFFWPTPRLLKCEALGMLFWHMKRCIANRWLFGTAFHYLLLFTGEVVTLTGIRLRVRSQMIFKAYTECPVAGTHSCGLSGALHFQSLEKPHPCLEKIFIFSIPCWCHSCCHVEEASAAWHFWKNQHSRISVQQIVYFRGCVLLLKVC